MRVDDVNGAAVARRVAELASGFATKDVSDDAEVRRALGSLVQETHYHACVGKYLSQHRDALGIRATGRKASGGRGEIWEKSSTVKPGAAARLDAARSADEQQLVRRGHDRTVLWMAEPAFAAIIELFDAEPAIGGTYFRPTEQGVQPVDLHPDSPKPLMGIGGPIRYGAGPERVAAELPQRVAELLRKRANAAPSREKQYEAALIRGAQAHHLRLAGLPDNLRFINSQWRFHKVGSADLPDLLAVDLDTGGLVVIELKADPTGLREAQEQAERYVRLLQRHASVYGPFFTSLARVMGQLYGCPELANVTIDVSRSRALAASP